MGVLDSVLVKLGAGSANVGSFDVNTTIAAQVSTDQIGAAPYAEITLAGATPYKLISAATTNGTSVKGSHGKVYSIFVSNQNAATRYLKLYNKATAPTVGSDTPLQVYAIPGGSAGAAATIALPMPLDFSLGIGFGLTTGVLDSDTGAVAVNEIVVNLGYV